MAERNEDVLAWLKRRERRCRELSETADLDDASQFLASAERYADYIKQVRTLHQALLTIAEGVPGEKFCQDIARQALGELQ